MRIATAIAGLFLIFSIGCQNKEQCLKKYHFDSCDEFKQAYNSVKDNDEALKLHSIAVECGCKPDSK